MSGISVHQFFDTLKINRVLDCDKVRVGREGDGGYIVLDQLCKGATLYSYGIGDDISFEVDFVNRYGGKAKCFDHTIDGIPTTDPRITFKKTGLGNGRNCNFPVSDVDLQDSAPRILKVDVEHNEWDWLSKWGPQGGWHQIIVELHVLPVSPVRPTAQYLNGGEVVYGEVSPYFRRMFDEFDDQVNDFVFKTYVRALDRLLAGYAVFHIHGNNSLPKATVDGYTWPQLLELSLVRKDLVTFVPDPDAQFPVPGLDFPNKTNRPDFTAILPFKNQ